MRVDLLDAREWLEVLRHIRNAIDQKAYDIARNVLQDMMNDIEDEIEEMDPNVGEGPGSIPESCPDELISLIDKVVSKTK